MHILLTNDDGPPDPSSSPYLATFIRVLTSPPFNHTVSVVVPTQQRSWIGKAHLLPPSSFPVAAQPGHFKSKNEDVSDIITPSYYDPVSGTSHHSPTPGYWVTAPGTPATCVQLALFHHALLFPHLRLPEDNANGTLNNSSHTSPTDHTPPKQDARKCPFDLILSGPNFGRNTTAAFALSSGTIGGALEGAVCGMRAIALSFAFYTRKESEELIEEASILSVRLIEKLCKDWDSAADSLTANGAASTPTDANAAESVPDLYSINVPLVQGISETPMHWTWMLPNQWNTGSLYQVVPPDSTSEDERTQVAPSFRWQPNFGDMWKTIDESPKGNDGKVIREKFVSVTPLKANFHNLFGSAMFSGELKL